MTLPPDGLRALARKYRVMGELRRILPPANSANSETDSKPDSGFKETSKPEADSNPEAGSKPEADSNPEAGSKPEADCAASPERAALRSLAVEFPGALRELDTLATDEIERRRAALDEAALGGAVEPWMRWMHAYHALMRAALALKRRLAAGAPVGDEERAAIARAAGVPVDDELVRAVADPPHGRLNVVVFDRLGAEFATAPKTIWDALYPPRKGDRPYRSR